jgi:hypothetical protein
MNKKIKILLIVIITIIVGILGYSQVLPIIAKHPSKDFAPISLDEAQNSQDSNMTLSFLYNITKEIHTTGSQENYKVKDYIVECLEQMNVTYEVKTQNLDEDFFTKLKNINRTNIIKAKNKFYDSFKKYTTNGDVDKYITEHTTYSSFNEYYKNDVLQGKDLEEYLEDIYEKNVQTYKNQTSNNIIVQLNSSTNPNAQNIMFVTHYDSAKNSYGASDAGMNVAGLLETIRCLKNEDFDNNIFVMFTDGEEKKFWGAYAFVETNDINIDLIINFDNSGSSGNLMLYHYSTDNLTKQYFKSVKKESSYSFINSLLYNTDSPYYQGPTSDAFKFIEYGYNTIDLALFSKPFNYHTQNDNFYNIDVTSLNNLATSMIDMVSYYGNNDIQTGNDETLFNFKLINGFVISVPQIVYIVTAVIFIVINFAYIIMLFKNKEKVIKKILAILLTLISLITLILFKNFSLLFSIPCAILFISHFIKNEKAKFIFKLVLFELYFFIIIQLVISLVQYIIWAQFDFEI